MFQFRQNVLIGQQFLGEFLQINISHKITVSEITFVCRSGVVFQSIFFFDFYDRKRRLNKKLFPLKHKKAKATEVHLPILCTPKPEWPDWLNFRHINFFLIEKVTYVLHKFEKR
jgi:hypothetical protein